MAKGTTIKDALAELEKTKGEPASEMVEVKLLAKIPLIDKMDASLSTLVKCEKLSLSTNCIEKIANLNALKRLKILSLGRNNIKSLGGLEAVGDSLEQLWISYNYIDKLRGLSALRKLQILYMTNNLLKSADEVANALGMLPNLYEVTFIGNPCCGDSVTDELYVTFRNKVTAACKGRMKKMDGEAILNLDDGDEQEKS